MPDTECLGRVGRGGADDMEMFALAALRIENDFTYTLYYSSVFVSFNIFEESFHLMRLGQVENSHASITTGSTLSTAYPAGHLDDEHVQNHLACCS